MNFVKILLLAMMIGCHPGVRTYQPVPTSTPKTDVSPTPAPKVQTHEDLVKFAMKAMEMDPPAKISKAKRMVVAEKIANFVMKNISLPEGREQYIAMVKNESNFDNSRRSPVGAIGIGQVMPSTFSWFIQVNPDLGAHKEDIYNEDINLMIGSLYFNYLLVEQDNNPRLASIAYNGGGKAAEKFKKLVNINSESANYALRTDHVKEVINKAIKDSETP